MLSSGKKENKKTLRNQDKAGKKLLYKDVCGQALHTNDISAWLLKKWIASATME